MGSTETTAVATASADGSISGRLSDAKVIVYFAEDPDQDWIAKIEARYPGIEVRWAKAYLDGAPVEAEVYGDLWKGVTHACIWWYAPPAHLLEDVKFVQLAGSGVDPWINHATYHDPNVVFCNGRGNNTPQIAEWVIGSWLASEHRFFRYHDYAKQSHWYTHDKIDVTDSYRRRMGILGYGAIGREVARMAKALNMEVYAYTHSEKATPEARKDHSFRLEGTGDPDGLLPSRWFHGGRESIDEFLAQDLDILVLSMPLTDLTAGLISSKQFEILSKKRTFLCNIARGKIVDTAALIAALEKGQIRGAALDVTDPEPLPQDHPLWKAPNLLVTPHTAWQTTNFLQRNLSLMEANLERLAQGRPLLNELHRTFGRGG
ncbi:D-3-phosphoglycerate dehydrogenase [Thozetella sp. PMI_491]|nr:D-3-phosphoglycerate dehydrogenase [Thozetella sp. PMI_491]